VRRDEATLLDIVSAANRAVAYAAGIEKSSLLNDDEKQSAILYQVIVLGEATKRLPPNSAHNILKYPGRMWQACASFWTINTMASTSTPFGM
jgi:uncharacterized protein with HEPN domain